MSKSKRHKKPRISLYCYAGHALGSNIFLVDKKKKLYKCVGSTNIETVRPPQSTWTYSFEDEKWIKFKGQNENQVLYWLPRKYWHL